MCVSVQCQTVEVTRSLDKHEKGTFDIAVLQMICWNCIEEI